MPLGDQLRHELSISPRQFGFVVSAYGICATVTGIIASTVIDRFDRRSTMLWSFFGFLLATLYCGLAPNFGHLLNARGLSGFCGGIVASTVMGFIVDLIPERRRGRAIGVVTSSFAFASTIGLPIGLSLANWIHRFGTPIIAIAVFGTFIFAATAIFLPSLPRTHRDLHVHPCVRCEAAKPSMVICIHDCHGIRDIHDRAVSASQLRSREATSADHLCGCGSLFSVGHEFQRLAYRPFWSTPRFRWGGWRRGRDDIGHHEYAAHQSAGCGAGRDTIHARSVESNGTSPSDDAAVGRSQISGGAFTSLNAAMSHFATGV